MPGPMEIRLAIPSSEHVALYLNGTLVGEVCCGLWLSRDDLWARVSRARCLEKMPERVRGLPEALRRVVEVADHVNTSKAARQQAFARGLMDGLERRKVPYPSEDLAAVGIPPVRPESTRSYECGYDYGETLRAFADYADEMVRETPGQGHEHAGQGRPLSQHGERAT